MGKVPERYQRFNDDTYWKDARGDYHKINCMETTHIINCIKMCLTKPSMVQNMMIDEIEKNPDLLDDQKVNLVNVITSQTHQQTVDSLMKCRLFNYFKAELKIRGVNCSMLFKNLKEEAISGINSRRCFDGFSLY